MIGDGAAKLQTATAHENPLSSVILNWAVILAIFLVGYWFVAIQPLGPNLSQMPGDLGDTRFNNYILEHDFRWITGKDPSLWTAPSFYPYPDTLAFSDNFLGSMLFYDIFRWSGLIRESACQAWYLLSFMLNFGACVYVLKKIGLKPLAIGAGAFFFTFGLPVLAQENHIQLSYRFCIPLACYALWRFSQERQLKYLVLLIFWWVWQFYLSIYLGYFLSLLLAVAIIGLTFIQERKLIDILLYWPRSIKLAWKRSGLKTNVVYCSVSALLIFVLLALLQPYVLTSKVYSFSRPWSQVVQELPRLKSYLISDRSEIWHSMSFLTSSVTDSRWEHQLFIGLPAMILLILGLFWRFQSPHRKMVLLFLGAAGILFLMTLDVKGFTLYKYLWHVPGFNSIRAVTRIILVMMWPIALLSAVELDALLRLHARTVVFKIPVLLLIGFMVVESALYNHDTFSKADSLIRLQTLQEEITPNSPQNPILYVWNPTQEPRYLTDLDAMLLSQDLGWPVMNGYSGNYPKGFGAGASTSCNQLISRIKNYINFAGITDPSFYTNLIPRIVSLGPEPCQWPEKLP